MKREQIEKAVNEYIGHAEEIGEGIDTCMRRKAFMDGAQWMADRLCIIPWDKALKELHDYWMEKEGEKKNEN